MSNNLQRHASRVSPSSFSGEGSAPATLATGLIDDLAQTELQTYVEASIVGFFVCFGLGVLAHSVYQKQQVKESDKSSASSSRAKLFALRLTPNTEIKSALTDFIQQNNIRAGAIVSCVGSTSTCLMRLSNAKAGETGSFKEILLPAEIVSFSGTVSLNGSHLHISLGDEQGDVFGGHLVKATVNTTCELVIAELEELVFSRPMDEQTGYGELFVQKRT